jgi:hypothetical protein
MTNATGVRNAVTTVLLAAAAILTLALEEPAPAFLPLVVAIFVAPWRTWKAAEPRRWRRRDVAALVGFLTALALTLLMPDGLVRSLTIAALTAAWMASVWLWNPDR